MKHIYGDVTEDLPTNMPEPRGNAVIIFMFIDAVFAGNLVTRRSQSGMLFLKSGTNHVV